MKPRFVGRLGAADAVTAGNAALGFVAAVLTTVDVGLAAKAILLAAMADGLDGVVARRYGGTDAGPYLDSLADVASFGVAPALLVVTVVHDTWGFDGGLASPRVVLAVAVTALFVAAAVVRLALYTAYDSHSDETVGVPTTLAATILSAGVLVGFVDPMLLVVLSAIMTALMLSDVTYPDLHAQDALVMGVVQGLAIVLSGTLGEGFAFGLLFLALGYLFLGPWFYWG